MYLSVGDWIENGFERWSIEREEVVGQAAIENGLETAAGGKDVLDFSVELGALRTGWKGSCSVL